MIARRGPSLRWRIAALSGLAIALLSIVAAVTAFLVVRSSIIRDLQASLREDARRVAQVYTGESAGSSLSGPTGGVFVQIYNAQGELVAASNTSFESLAIAPETVIDALGGTRDWRGELDGQSLQAVLEPVGFGVVVVLANTAYIGNALAKLARALLLTAVILIALSAVIGYLVAAATMRPITQLAVLAARLDPNYLNPIDYEGPEDEVGQLSVVLNDLIVRLKDSMDGQRSFLAETSHELRTPLTSLQGFLSRALRRAGPEVRTELEDAQRIAQGMSRLVADLLQLSRGELVRELVPHLLEPYSDILKPVAEEFPGISCEGKTDALLLGDPERLKQLIRNLTANALRATGDPQAVMLRLVSDDKNVVFEVHDSGPGIPAEILPHIFDKFYKGAGGGAGLGLAIAKQIAEMHQGSIEVSSQEGQGTSFRVSFAAFSDENDI